MALTGTRCMAWAIATLLVLFTVIHPVESRSYVTTIKLPTVDDDFGYKAKLHGISVTDTPWGTRAAVSFSGTETIGIADPAKRTMSIIMQERNVSCTMLNGSSVTVDDISYANGVEFLDSYNVLVGVSMPSPTLVQLSTPSKFTQFNALTTSEQRLVGAGCDFDQVRMPSTQTNNLGAQIYPVDYTLFIPSRKLLLFSQFTVIGFVQGAEMGPYLGQVGSYGARDGATNTGDVQRLATKTAHPSQMVTFGDYVYVAESGMRQLRRIDMGSGLARVIAGGADNKYDTVAKIEAYANSCVRGSPCAAQDLWFIKPQALALYHDSATNNLVTYLGDRSQSLIYRIDWTGESNSTGYVVAGKVLHNSAKDGNFDIAQFAFLTQFSSLPSEPNTLYIADMNLRVMHFDAADHTPLPPPSAHVVPDHVCDVFEHCNGNAQRAFGIPAITCTCECKDGFNGTACEIRLLSNTTTIPLEPTLTVPLPPTVSHTAVQEPEEEDEPAVPPALIESGETTIIVASIAVGIVNPTVAAQASRTKLLFQLSQCQKDFEEPLDIAQNMLQLSLGTTKYRYYWGALVGNVCAMGLLLALHATIAYGYAIRYRTSLVDAHRVLRFPSLHAFLLLLLLEGTTMAATSVLAYSGNGILIFCAFVTLVLSFAIVGGFAYFFKRKFSSRFRPFRGGSEDNSGTDHEEPFRQDSNIVNESLVAPPPELQKQGCMGKLLESQGKWIDTKPHHHKRRFGLFFFDYTERCSYFIAIELGMCMATGILDGIQPSGAACLPLLVFVAITYVSFFLLVVMLQPFLIRLNFLAAMLVALFQAIAAVQLVALAASGNDFWERSSSAFSLMSVYLIAMKGIVDIFTALRYVMRFVLRRFRRQRAGDAESTRVNMNIDDLRGAHAHLETTAADEQVQPHRDPTPPQQPATATPTTLALPENGIHSQDAAALAVDNMSFGREMTELDDILSVQPQDPSPVGGESTGFPRLVSQDLDEILGGPISTNASFAGPKGPRELLTHEKMRLDLQAYMNAGGGGPGGAANEADGTPLPNDSMGSPAITNASMIGANANDIL